MYETYSRLVKLASWFAVATATLLIVLKLMAWWMSDSIAILASVTDSLLDLVASLASLLILRFSLMPADNNHSFGHGKAESLAALIQGAFISGSAIFLLLHSIARIMNPQPLATATFAIIVMLISTVFTFLLVSYQGYVINQTQSPAIKADRLHYKTDLLMNIAVLLGLILSHIGYIYMDAIFALMIALYIFASAIRIAIDAIHLLLDRALPNDEIEQIWEIIQLQTEIIGVHDLRTRRSGATRFIQLHLELADDLPLWRAHQITDQLENQLIAKFPMSDIIIHQEPASVVQQELNLSN